MYKVYMKHEWISCLDLNSIAKIHHYVYAGIPQSEKIQNPKCHWSQGFAIRDIHPELTHPMLVTALRVGLMKVPFGRCRNWNMESLGRGQVHTTYIGGKWDSNPGIWSSNFTLSNCYTVGQLEQTLSLLNPGSTFFPNLKMTFLYCQEAFHFVLSMRCHVLFFILSPNTH